MVSSTCIIMGFTVIYILVCGWFRIEIIWFAYQVCIFKLFFPVELTIGVDIMYSFFAAANMLLFNIKKAGVV